MHATALACRSPVKTRCNATTTMRLRGSSSRRWGKTRGRATSSSSRFCAWATSCGKTFQLSIASSSGYARGGTFRSVVGERGAGHLRPFFAQRADSWRPSSDGRGVFSHAMFVVSYALEKNQAICTVVLRVLAFWAPRGLERSFGAAHLRVHAASAVPSLCFSTHVHRARGSCITTCMCVCWGGQNPISCCFRHMVFL